MWSDHGTNFVGASRELKEMYEFLNLPETQRSIYDHCSTQGIQWRFIPENAPHFGGLWEAAVKSLKYHLRRIVGDVRLTFEELSTVLTQIEACLNSRPLTPLPEPEDGYEALTPGHFLIGKPLEALPESLDSRETGNLIRRWRLCQKLTMDFWQRWSNEYLTYLQRCSKWATPTKNLQVGDVVCVRGQNLPPTKWPLARIVQVYPGKDGHTRVATVRTAQGTYRRPITKLVPLLTNEKDF